MRKIILLIIVILFSSCKEENSRLATDEEIILDLFDEKFNSIQYLYIIPRNGCGSCIETSIDFMKLNYQNKNIKFIFIATSKKEIKHIFGVENYQNHVLIDDKLVLETLGVTFTDPVIYKVENGHLSKKTIIDEFNIEYEQSVINSHIL